MTAARLGTRVPCSVEHAHQHVVPADVEVLERLDVGLG